MNNIKDINIFAFVAIFFGALNASAKNIVLEDFESGNFTWKSRSDLAKVRKEYLIQIEDKNHFLRGSPPVGESGKVAILKQEIFLDQTPILKWRWRAITLPKTDSLSDSVASVYIHFKYGMFGTRLLKYTWATNSKETGWIKPQKKSSFWDMRTKVLRSGPSLNEWFNESVNIQKDYIEAFDADSAPKESQGIGILTDGDQSKSISIGDFDDFVVTQDALSLIHI